MEPSAPPAGHLKRLPSQEMDWVRLPAKWRERIFVLPVALALDDDGELLRHVETAIAAHKDI